MQRYINRSLLDSGSLLDNDTTFSNNDDESSNVAEVGHAIVSSEDTFHTGKFTFNPNEYDDNMGIQSPSSKSKYSIQSPCKLYDKYIFSPLVNPNEQHYEGNISNS